jgi:hypothetical protein
MGLIRILLPTAAAYSLTLIAFPEWGGHQTYHTASLAVIAAAAIGLWFTLKAMDISFGLMKLCIELCFAGAVVLYLAYTMPQKSGFTPMEQWAQGHRPTQAEARQGLMRLGIDANAKPGSMVVSLFPTH